jgi:hypothetical protein
MATHWFRRSVALWLPTAGAATVLAFAIYGGVQQAQRADAYDPELQIARDAAAALAAGASPQEVASGSRVDVAESLAPWLAIYGADGTPLAATGSYHGQPPIIPDQARSDAQGGELTFTWEPTDGLRLATIVEPYPGGTVVAARSMQQLEEREARTLAIAAAAWLAALGAAAVGAVLGVWLRDRGEQPH